MSGETHQGRHGEYIAQHLQGAVRAFGGATPAPQVPSAQDADEQDETEMEETAE